MIVWSVVGMALFRHVPKAQRVNPRDSLLPGKRPFLGVLLAYNLLRFQMAQKVYSLKGMEPNQLSFSQATAFLIKEWMMLPAVLLGRTPE